MGFDKRGGCRVGFVKSISCKVIDFFFGKQVMAMGFIGKETYLAETWNCLDFAIVLSG